MNLFIKIIASFFLLLSISTDMFSQENSVLPYPKSLSFGANKFLLKNAKIVLPEKPTTEDKFAFKQLQQIIKEKTGIELPIAQFSEKGEQDEIRISKVGVMPALPLLNEISGPNSREAYRISVKSNEITFNANSSAGIYYGIQTLTQMIQYDGINSFIKEMELNDYPSIAYRALMMDFSHGGLLTVDEIKRQIDFLARFKTNQYFFYTEISIEMDGYESINYEASYSKGQIKDIIEYARQRHLDVVPNINLYGHVHELLRNEKYKSLGVATYGQEFDPKNPKAVELIKNWIKQYAELFPSKFIHVGCDETWENQYYSYFKGVNLEAGQLYIDQLTFINEEFKKLGKTTMAWTDMAEVYPDIVSKFPKDVIPVAWNYWGDSENLYKTLNPITKYRTDFFVQPGISGWSEIYPASYSLENMDRWMKIAKDTKAKGYITSIWTDLTEPLIRPSWMFACYGSVVSWQGTTINSEKFQETYSRIIFPNNSKELRKVFQLFDSAQFHLTSAVLNSDAITWKWANPFDSLMLENTRKHLDDLSIARKLSEDIQDILIPIIRSHSKDSIYLNSLLVSAKMIHYTGSRFLFALYIADDRWKAIQNIKNNDHTFMELKYLCHSFIHDIMDENGELKKAYEKQWLYENMPYRLNPVLSYYDFEAAYWRKLSLQLLNFDFAKQKKQNEKGIPIESFVKLFKLEY